jgi:hypothetical protein
MATCFSKRELFIIREMLTVGSISTPGIDQYLENTDTDKEYLEGNKILYKLGYSGINKDGTDKEDDELVDDV